MRAEKRPLVASAWGIFGQVVNQVKQLRSVRCYTYTVIIKQRLKMTALPGKLDASRSTLLDLDQFKNLGTNPNTNLA
jgi:hypothetical protein